MRFFIGLLVGFGLGFVGAILLAPERRQRLQSEWEATPPPDEPEGEALGGNHDLMGALRRTMRSLQGQVEEAWREALEAAEEAEKEMRARYGRRLGRAARRE